MTAYLIAGALWIAGAAVAAWAFGSLAHFLRDDAYWDDRAELELAEEET